jgi:DNA-binding NtrC family response regulator
MRPGVLFVSPRPEDAKQLSRILVSMKMDFEHVPNLQQARVRMLQDPCNVVLTASNLPDGAWIDVLDLARQVSPGAEVIVTDPGADARFWADALNLGAYDLLAQPFYESEVRRILWNACSRMPKN